MKISVVYIHPLRPRVIVHTQVDSYVLVQLRFRADIGRGDVITGDPLLPNVRWFLNVTRGLLIDIHVCGCYPTLAAAMLATSAPHTAEALRRFRPFTPGIGQETAAHPAPMGPGYGGSIGGTGHAQPPFATGGARGDE